MGERVWERMWPPEISYDYNGMNLELACAIIDGANRKAEALGFAMTNAVCDAGGNLVALQKMLDYIVAMVFIETHDQKSPLRDLLANLLNIQ